MRVLTPRRRWLVIGVCALALVLVVALVAGRIVRDRLDRTDLQRAADVVPSSTLRLAFTDWSAVRARLGVAEDPGKQQLATMMSRAYDTELSAASTIDESAQALRAKFGFGPGNAQWEVYAQSRKGAVMVLRMPDDTDFDKIADHLDELGYTRPKSENGVWSGGPELIAQLDPTITPELQYVTLDADRHLVLASDTGTYLKTAAAVARGKGRSLADDAGERDLLGKVAEPAAAFAWTGGFVCEDLAMSQAAPEDRTTGESLVRRAGGITPLDGVVEAMSPDRELTVAMGFESEDQAEHDLRPRARLYAGPSVTRSQSFAVDLPLTRSRSDGSAVLLQMRARQKTGPVLSILSAGPVLFLTC